MSEVILSRAVRSNVSSLRKAAQTMAAVQTRLATGKRINTAFDNPTIFFKAAQMTGRANELNRVVDNIATASKTLEAANDSLTALTGLVNSAQSVANSALASPRTTAGRTGTVAGLTLTGAFGVGFGSTITVSDGTTTAAIISLGTVSVQQIIDTVNSTSGLKVKASLTSDGRILLEATQNNSIVIGGTASSAQKAQFGLASGTTAAGVLNTARSSLATQFDAILKQIDQVVVDSGVNGVNLLGGNTLKIDFNETGTSSLSIAGTTINSASLGLAVAQNTWQTDKDINDALGGLKAAVSTLQAQAAIFSSNVSLVDAREEFTKSMIDTLQSSADDLLVADTNEESATLLALQTRQELSITALSLAVQSESSALRLFR
jgi:flagellin